MCSLRSILIGLFTLAAAVSSVLTQPADAFPASTNFPGAAYPDADSSDRHVATAAIVTVATAP